MPSTLPSIGTAKDTLPPSRYPTSAFKPTPLPEGEAKVRLLLREQRHNAITPPGDAAVVYDPKVIESCVEGGATGPIRTAAEEEAGGPPGAIAVDGPAIAATGKGIVEVEAALIG